MADRAASPRSARRPALSNALASETSPYLRQHAEHPVDWLPWGQEAFRRAHRLDRPVLVSIGYSSCHWCHVMEHESFADERTAQLMNESFICVKVDREERPDVDALYMEAVQSMTGRGGWPLNVFLTPDQLPFYGGTYFPPEPRHGMPAWTQVLQAISELWETSREEVCSSGERLRDHLAGARLAPAKEPPSPGALERAVENLRELYDAQSGGFGGAPKFPQASVIEFLLLRGELEPALPTLQAMARGGIHDQLGGGFSRYSVDATWTVPHFEKMLYDNALLARAYLHGWQRFVERRLLEVCLDTLGWAMREMRGPEGGFYSALDADSEGVEGRYYVWTVAQLREALGEDATAAIDWFAATEQGNFSDPHHPSAQHEALGPGLNVLQSPRGAEEELDEATLKRIRERLLAERVKRVRPGLDDKRLTSWNALMICALAETGAALRDESVAGVDAALADQLLAAAVACAEFIMRDLRDEQGRLLRTYNDGRAKLDAYLEDYAFLLEALLVLFETTCEERWFREALALADELIERFADPARGGFFSTAADGQPLIARRKDLEDSPIPAGGSSAAMGLLRLSQLTGDEPYERHAVSVLRLLAEIAPRHPSSFGHLLQVMHWYLSPARPIACAVPVGVH